MKNRHRSGAILRHFAFPFFTWLLALTGAPPAQAVVLPPGATTTTLTVISVDGVFVTIPTPYDPPGTPVFADFNGDGQQDLLVQATDGSDTHYLFLADSDGKFTSVAQSWKGGRPSIDGNPGAGRSDELHGSNGADGRGTATDLADSTVAAASLSGTAVMSVGAAAAPAAATAVGATSGAFDVSPTGAAIYTLPIAVPPGIADLAPELALVYNSQGGNGSAGVGWNLSGLSLLHRCGRTIAQDGAAGAVDFGANDRFCLDGQRLVRIGSVDGGTEYRTEIESYARVVAYGGRAGDPTYFKIWGKDGSVRYYGTSADSRIEAQGRSDNAARLWALQRVTDLKGNALSFHYAENQSLGEFHLDRIDYAGNRSVRLTYEARPDALYTYASGAMNAVTQRLKAVKTYVSESGADTLVRDVRLYYDTAVATGRSRLTAVQECGATTCLAPTTFAWQEGGSGFSVSTWSGHAGGTAKNVTADFDGDGRTDLASYIGSGNWNVCRANATGNGFSCSTMAAHSGGESNNVTGDFNGDGRADLATYSGPGSTPNTAKWNVCLSTGSGFSCGIRTSHNTSAKRNITGDFNADGKADMAGYDVIARTWTVCLSTGSDFSCSVWANDSSINTIDSGDFNGDGKTDLLYYHPYAEASPYSNSYVVCLSTGASFSCGAWPTPLVALYGDAPIKSRLGDFNGDGLSDIAIDVGRYGNPWVMCLSTGTAFACGEWNGTSALSGDITGDFNGDGRTDIANNSSGSTWNVCFSTGGGFDCRSWAAHSRGMKNTVLGDFNGDGRSDLAGYSGAGSSWDIALASGAAPDLLTGITSGFGSQVLIQYKPLTDTTINPTTNRPFYTKYTNGVAGEVVDIQAPIYAVAEYRTSNGIGGVNVVINSYEGLKANLRGRGLLGFARTLRHDVSAKTETTTTYRQDGFPYTGLVTSSVVKVDTLTSHESTSQYKTVTATPGTDGVARWSPPYAYEVVDRKYELNGTLVTTSTTTTSQNRYGSNESVTTTIVGDRDDAGNALSYRKSLSNTFVYQGAGDPALADWYKTAQVSTATATNTVPRRWGDTHPQGLMARKSTFTYHPDGLLQTETIEPDNSPLTQTTTYGYDGYGNRTSVSVSGYGLAAARTTRTAYSVNGLFPVSVTNALGHRESRTFDTRFGTVTRLTGPNGLATTYGYDEFGRATSETRPDGTTTTTEYGLCSATLTCWGYEVYFTTTRSSGAPTTVAYYDQLGREARSTTEGFDGRLVTKRTTYDTNGRVSFIHLPAYPDEVPKWIAYTYDLLGRLTKERVPASDNVAERLTQTVYAPFKTTTIDANGYYQVRETNALGQLVRLWDEDPDLKPRTTPPAVPIQTLYDYEPFGGLRYIKEPYSTNETVIYFDGRGRKVAADDPDLGHWEYEYNGVGELTRQWDAKSGRNTTRTPLVNAAATPTVALEYDALGRLVRRTEADEGVSQWVYDTATMGIGKLATVTGPNGYTRSHTYDALGRPTRVTTTVGASALVAPTTLEVETGYDSLGRVRSVRYPATGNGTRLEVINDYTATGYLSKATNSTTGTVYWQATKTDAAGRLTEELLGNGLKTTRTYDPGHGHLLGITTGINNGTGFQNLRYTYDAGGNLKTRQIALPAINYTETFTYDVYNRLTAVGASGGPANKTYSYERNGNLKAKSDTADRYVYGDSAHPHAVTQLTNAAGTSVIASYSYDQNGNMTGGQVPGGIERTIEYTRFNLPKKVKQGANTALFEYDVDHQRIVEKADNELVVSLNPRLDTGIHFEKVQRTDTGVTEYRHFIYGGSGPVALYTVYSDTTPPLTHYLHYDHLGSLEAVTGDDGALKKRFGYDAFGKRRLPTGVDGTVPPAITRYGYTSHEMFDKVGLVHMSGRMYDPTLGRFIGADPKGGGLSYQGLNRYAYAGNNPLTNVDPSGYSWWSKTYRKLLSGESVRLGMGIVMGMATGGMLSGVLSEAAWNVAATEAISTGTLTAMTTSAGFVAGAVGGFTTGYVASGGNMEVARKGALSAALFAGVGEYFGHGSGAFLSGQHMIKVAAHAAAGCVANAATGGDCGSGALSAGFAEFAGPKLPSGFGGGLASRAAVGGVGSVLGGGKFGDGAMTAAYGYLFNEAAHYQEDRTKGQNTWQYAKNSVLRVFGLEDRIVIGENMAERVIPYAEKNNADWYEPTPGSPRDQALTENTAFIVQKMDQGYTVVDIGSMPGRANYPLPTSPFYLMEVIHVYGRNGKLPYEHLVIDRQP